ncbi:hypothetical protein T552_04140 [Pneumocystis carinii B80]|uniref:UDP-N-acetylglucosamine transferase subunit ALG14 n=1 Tax=Pneumocystis carinii (strain B80) TaxID=1408658 RepID=A0A0W4ZII3_PNEC8|nr:hypothetical protein T552_04140 [Pneumocystis carinii B80]KTW28188.1 hypothetical protein T552_04140 [Pneumocystis carinii B80]
MDIRIIYVLTKPRKHKHKSRSKDDQIKLLIFLGSGGHTAEMIRLLKKVDFLRYSKRTYVISAGDFLSKGKVRKLEIEKTNSSGYAGKYYIENVPRARYVNQVYYTTAFSSILCLISCLKILLWNKLGRPDALLCNGPGSSVMMCLAAIITEIFGLNRPDIIFIESFARVKSLSLSGRILLYLVDRFIVQWPDLIKKSSKIEYYGILI